MANTKRNGRDKELDNIKRDLDSLKTNVVALSRTIKDDVQEEAVEGIQTLRRKSNATMARVEENVRVNPGKSMFVAFMGGLFTSALLKQNH